MTMAKTTILKERGTGAVLYPQTIPSQVIFPDGTDLNDVLAAQKQETEAALKDYVTTADFEEKHDILKTDMESCRKDVTKVSDALGLSIRNMSSTDFVEKHKGISTTGQWWSDSNDAQRHVEIPVSPGDTIELTVSGGGGQMTFTKTNNETKADLCDGWTRVMFDNGSTVRYRVPNDARYLMLTTIDGALLKLVYDIRMEQVGVIHLAHTALFDDLFLAAAGTWGKIDYSHFENGVSKPYYLNELWLTYEEAVDVMDWGAITTYSTLARYKNAKIRTNLPPRVGATSDANTTTAFDLKYFDYGSDIEILNLACEPQAGNYGFVVAPQGGGWDYGLSGSKLRKVLGIVNLGKLTSTWNDMLWTPKLEEIRISHLKVNFSFRKCPLISAASIRYLIGERSGTNAITVTLHADTYAKLTSAVDDPDDEWYGLIDLAAAKQITFACA